MTKQKYQSLGLNFAHFEHVSRDMKFKVSSMTDTENSLKGVGSS